MRLNILHVNYFINMFANTQTTFTLSQVIYRLENQQDAYQMYLSIFGVSEFSKCSEVGREVVA